MDATLTKQCPGASTQFNDLAQYIVVGEAKASRLDRRSGDGCAVFAATHPAICHGLVQEYCDVGRDAAGTGPAAARTPYSEQYWHS